MKDMNLDVVEKYEMVVEKEFNGEEVRVVSSKQMADDMDVKHNHLLRRINETLAKMFNNDDFIKEKRGKEEVVSVPQLGNPNPVAKQGFVIFDSTYENRGKQYKCYYMNDIAYEVILNNMQGKEKEKLARLLYFKAKEQVANGLLEKSNIWDDLSYVFNKNNMLSPELAVILDTGKKQYLELKETKENVVVLEETLEQTESELQETLPSAVMFKLVDKSRTFYPKDLELVLDMGKFKAYKCMRQHGLVNLGDTRPTQHAINNGLAMWDNRTKSPVLTVDGLISLMTFISPVLYQQHLTILASL